MTEPLERDVHLQGALRHAPDANAAPPAALSEAILRAAHGAVAQRAAPAPPAWLRQLSAAWAWLGQPRLAGALAGLMVATLVGVLWWDQPLERALDPAAQAPLRSSDSAAAPAGAKRPAEMAVAKPELARPVQEYVAQTPAVAVARTAPKSAAAPSPAIAPTPAIALGPAPVPAPVPAPEPAPSPAVAPSPAIATEPAPATARAPAATPTPEMARGPAPTRSKASADASAAGAGETRLAEAVIAKTAPTQDAALEGTRSLAAPATSATAPAMPRADARDRAEPSAANKLATAQARKSTAPLAAAALGSLADVRAAIAAQPDRWAWQMGANPPRAMTGELQAWLARLDAASGAALGSAALPGSDTAQVGGATLHLVRDSQPHSSIHFGTDAVQVVGARGAQSQRRPGLAPQTARELAEELAQIAAR
mgnify:CR=1 FL=1